jgi:hypothetical protein
MFCKDELKMSSHKMVNKPLISKRMEYNWLQFASTVESTGMHDTDRTAGGLPEGWKHY